MALAYHGSQWCDLNHQKKLKRVWIPWLEYQLHLHKDLMGWTEQKSQQGSCLAVGIKENSLEEVAWEVGYTETRRSSVLPFTFEESLRLWYPTALHQEPMAHLTLILFKNSVGKLWGYAGLGPADSVCVPPHYAKHHGSHHRKPLIMGRVLWLFLQKESLPFLTVSPDYVYSKGPTPFWQLKLVVKAETQGVMLTSLGAQHRRGCGLPVHGRGAVCIHVPRLTQQLPDRNQITSVLF